MKGEKPTATTDMEQNEIPVEPPPEEVEEVQGIAELDSWDDPLFTVLPLPRLLASHGVATQSWPGAYAMSPSGGPQEGRRPPANMSQIRARGEGYLFHDADVPPAHAPAPAMTGIDVVISGATVVQEEDLLSSETALHPDSSPTIIEGRILQERRPSKVVTLCLLVLSLVTIATVLLSIFIVTDPPQLNARHTTKTSTLYPPFQDTLPPHILQAIQDVHSPLYTANRWMLEDPHLDEYSQEQQEQRFILAYLYFATNGDTWLRNDHWLSYNVSECDWYTSSSLTANSKYYVPQVCNDNHSIVSLSLAHNNLTGTLPVYPYALLPELRAFDLTNNTITGDLPVITSADHIEFFAIAHNDFTGTHRGGTDDLSCPSLKAVDTSGNRITNSVPNTDGYVARQWRHTIEFWDSSDNLFRGTMATELGLVTGMTVDRRANNLMTGSIPSQIGLLTQLQYLDVSGNLQMTGAIPTELGLLTALKYFAVAGTSMSGSIPSNLCTLKPLQVVANCSMVTCCQADGLF